MAHWKIITGLFFASVLVTECSRTNHHQRREAISNLCNIISTNSSGVQCFCDTRRETDLVYSAECFLTKKDTSVNDTMWSSFNTMATVEKLSFINARGIAFKYVPSEAFKELPKVVNVDVKNGDIKEIHPYAFANVSTVEEIRLSDNQIEVLSHHAFIHHEALLTIALDQNKITEINRDVFVDLPKLKKLYLTRNKISTIHDRALMYLNGLKELELDNNKIFSLNAETFSGLTSLHRLSLSKNNLEVIGENTFIPLENLQSLDLDENKIEMLDDQAFNGLARLQSLSLARNKIMGLEDRIFRGLTALVSLNLKSNIIYHLRAVVMAPILRNFYGAANSFEFDENNFPCDCELDWFVALKNETQNSRLKLSIENLKCTPDDGLAEQWKKLEDTDKNTPSGFEEELVTKTMHDGDYEYYDESQLDGKLFYVDIRDLLNCSQERETDPTSPLTVTPKPMNIPTNTMTRTTIHQFPIEVSIPTTAPKRQATVSNYPTTVHKSVPPYITEPAPVSIHKVAENMYYDREIHTTPKRHSIAENVKANEDKTKHSFTTSRLATVSANPIEGNQRKENDNNIYRHMASDEAAKEQPAAPREAFSKPSAAHMNLANLAVIISILVFNLG